MKKLLCLALVALPLAFPTHSRACTIPVFRYALEKWELTPYEIMVFHRGPLPADVEKELRRWENATKDANIEITRIDLAGDMTGSQRKLWAKEGDDKQTPWMIVRYVAADPTEGSSWRGPCTTANLASVVDSPMRRAVLAHLMRGDSTVFILMTSEDAKADEAAFRMVRKELQKLEARIKLPVQADTGPQIKLPIPLKVSFPILVLDRNRAEEAGFVRLLLGVEERLLDRKGPILFPIFGRGRVLGGLNGPKELNEEGVMEVAKFLCRECSCQVKELNPGIDMLMVTHWEDAFNKLYDGKQPIEMPKLAPIPQSWVDPNGGDTVSTEAKTPTDVQPPPVPSNPAPTIQSPGAEKSERTPFDLRFFLWMGIGVASGLVLLSGSWVVYQVRK